MKNYDIVMIGHISKNILIYRNDINRITAGPVIYSSMAAVKSGASVLVITWAKKEDSPDLDIIRHAGIDTVLIESKNTTSIENTYFSEDKERRTLRLLSRAEPFSSEILPVFDAKIIHMAGLFAGEIPDEMIIPLSRIGNIAVDAQGIVRSVFEGKALIRDWDKKKEYLPHIRYLKTDAAEAEILTGLTDREKAARVLNRLGAGEVMVTLNTEVIVCNSQMIYRAPLTPGNLSGRTGRGDSCFAAYPACRLKHSIQESVDYAAALVSIKMETPGPFTGTEKDVMNRIGS